MGFTDAIRTCFQQYATFTGRSRRAEFWWWALFTLIVSIAGGLIDQALFPDHFSTRNNTGPVGGLFGLIVLLPTLAVTARRLHDIDKSGWWQLLSFIPFVGWIIMVVWTVRDSEPGSNRFGPNPKVAPSISGPQGPYGSSGIQDYVPPRS